ncbi:hypothetical protein [Polaromonas sp.]|uniref:hypothetical protein n=1 Tax=Polaromonas sp. TaxID=1869339 RepID=UPI00286CD515|nr:hypothetical protein [Polaromonas sp.]
MMPDKARHWPWAMRRCFSGFERIGLPILLFEEPVCPVVPVFGVPFLSLVPPAWRRC